jgi:hypothetical protein
MWGFPFTRCQLIYYFICSLGLSREFSDDSLDAIARFAAFAGPVKGRN